MTASRSAVQNVPVELSFQSAADHGGAPDALDVDVVFTAAESGAEWRVPAYWAGGGEWRVRFAAPASGEYTFRTECGDAADSGLHGLEGTLEAAPYEGDNPLYRHGAIRLRDDHRGFEYADGTPFLWLGDTWWMALCSRLGWPDDFQELTALRRGQGFTLIQLVAGLFPDMPAFDPRGDNGAGWPWEPDFARINPAFFDEADLKVRWLVRAGLVPCILGCWGYYLPWLGMEKMKRHWRYIIARWGACPVVWCLAGEAAMPWYLTPIDERDTEIETLRNGWAELGAYVRETDPFGRPVTAHPRRLSADDVADPSVLDFHMVQCGHGDLRTAISAAGHAAECAGRDELQPVVNGEVCYEGIMGTAHEHVQRFLFWSSMLSGVRGYTYGANGLWQLNGDDVPYGPSPHGGTWGDRPWREASRLPGARQVALGKALLAEYPWWEMDPHPEWVTPPAPEGDHMRPYAAGVPGRLHIVYFPQPLVHWKPQKQIAGLEEGVRYAATFFDPATGRRWDAGPVEPDGDGVWPVPTPPLMQDMVLVLDRQDP